MRGHPRPLWVPPRPQRAGGCPEEGVGTAACLGPAMAKQNPEAIGRHTVRERPGSRRRLGHESVSPSLSPRHSPAVVACPSRGSGLGDGNGRCFSDAAGEQDGRQGRADWAAEPGARLTEAPVASGKWYEAESPRYMHAAGGRQRWPTLDRLESGSRSPSERGRRNGPTSPARVGGPSADTGQPRNGDPRVLARWAAWRRRMRGAGHGRTLTVLSSPTREVGSRCRSSGPAAAMGLASSRSSREPPRTLNGLLPAPSALVQRAPPRDRPERPTSWSSPSSSARRRARSASRSPGGGEGVSGTPGSAATLRRHAACLRPRLASEKPTDANMFFAVGALLGSWSRAGEKHVKQEASKASFGMEPSALAKSESDMAGGGRFAQGGGAGAPAGLQGREGAGAGSRGRMAASSARRRRLAGTAKAKMRQQGFADAGLTQNGDRRPSLPAGGRAAPPRLAWGRSALRQLTWGRPLLSGEWDRRTGGGLQQRCF